MVKITFEKSLIVAIPMNEMRRNNVEAGQTVRFKKRKMYGTAGRIYRRHRCVALFNRITTVIKANNCMHEIKTCPRCQKAFECKAGSITICQCTDVKISPQTRELLGKKYDECLCKDCLMEIEAHPRNNSYNS